MCDDLVDTLLYAFHVAFKRQRVIDNEMSGEVMLIDEGSDGSPLSLSETIFGWLRVAHIGAHFLINSVSLAFTEI
jgi:hypothetical protein